MQGFNEAPSIKDRWVKGKGVIKLKKERLFVQVDRDILEYYKWFLSREYFIKFNSPKHGGHINIINSLYHRNINWFYLKKYNNLKIGFEYSVNIRAGGFTKDFINFFLAVRSPELLKIKKKNVISDKNIQPKFINKDYTSSFALKKYGSFHLTIANTKGLSDNNFFPDMIKIVV